jgi:hypothetical protein
MKDNLVDDFNDIIDADVLMYKIFSDQIHSCTCMKCSEGIARKAVS